MTLVDESGTEVPAAPDDDSVRPVQRFVWRPVETAPVPDLPAAALRGRRVVVLGGRAEVADAVLAVLRGAGADPHRLVPGSSVSAFRDRVVTLDAVVDLNLAGDFDPDAPPAWSAPFGQTIELLQSCYADWVAETDANRLGYLAVTRMGGVMGFGGAGMPQPLGGLWAGLAKGLPREIPNCNVRVLDLADEYVAGLPTLVARELYRWGLFEVGYCDGRRYTLVADPQPVPAPRLPLRPGDVVVMSGGGRGIGFALARALAADVGCRVLVSGRGPVPDPATEPALSLTADGFRAYRDSTLVDAAAERRLPAARAALARLEQARELWANLSRARADGLDITYHRCDITDADAVARLIEAAGPRLVGVVHNAGVDLPARLPAKRPSTLATVVGVKVDGYLNLARAVQGRPGVRFFCNVGSLTGRWGGMVGQLDYGAANEALSRLGLWADRAIGGPRVSTVCWPTWEQLGMITNYEATLRYMSAVDVAEGLHHWQRELLSGAGGEVTFIGEVGPAMLPSVLRGYRQDTGLSAIERLVTSRFFLGEPVRFEPYRAIVSTNLLRAGAMPCCDDVRLDGVPALPVSLLLAYLVSVGEWVQPEDGPVRTLAEVRDIRVTFTGLAASAGREELRLRKEGVGRRTDGAWLVDVTIRRDGAALAHGTLVYRAAAPFDGVPGAPREGQAGAPAAVRAGRLSWSGHVFRIATPHRLAEDGRWWVRVEPDRMNDLLTDGVPGAGVPLNTVENMLRAAQPGAADGLAIDRLTLYPDPPDSGAEVGGWLLGSPDGRDWMGLDAAGRPSLTVTGLRFTDES